MVKITYNKRITAMLENGETYNFEPDDYTTGVVKYTYDEIIGYEREALEEKGATEEEIDSILASVSLIANDIVSEQ